MLKQNKSLSKQCLKKNFKFSLEETRGVGVKDNWDDEEALDNVKDAWDEEEDPKDNWDDEETAKGILKR